MKVLTVIIVFAFSSFVFAQQGSTVVEEQEVCHDYISLDPEFSGGETAMMLYITNNFEYPQSAMDNVEQGKVYVQFVIEKDGSITDVKVLRGVSEAIDNEALRLIKEMPKWKPGEVDGNKVPIRLIIPIIFKLG
ncbi:MAG: energy transducer TonB [Crocinitomicaceae bacterium]|nr:energy transducer TonB [Crocinitomicaceae bacterium]